MERRELGASGLPRELLASFELQVRVAGEAPWCPDSADRLGGPGPASSISPCIAGAEAVWSWGRGQCNHPEPFPVESFLARRAAV